MKYQCIQDYIYNHQKVMTCGDIIVLGDDELYNVTTGLDFKGIKEYIDTINKCLVAITDDLVNYSKHISSKTDLNRFEDITKRMVDTFRKKNHDYGNSFEQSLNEEGLAASRIRMGDKWNRYKTLSKKESSDIQVKDESIRDTLLDLANYAIMTVIWLDKQNGNV